MSDTIGRRYLKTLLERDAARADLKRAEATLAGIRAWAEPRALNHGYATARLHVLALLDAPKETP